jgi:hypothetical protein
MIPCMTLRPNSDHALPRCAALATAWLALLTAAIPAQTSADREDGASSGPALEAPRRELTGHRRVLEIGEGQNAGPIDVVFLHGTIEERGFAEGYLFAEEMADMFRRFVLARAVPNPGLWSLLVRPQVAARVEFPKPLLLWVRSVLEGARARDEENPDDDLLYLPELRRELDVQDLLSVATIPDFLGLACSSFANWGDDVEGGGPLVGRNLDYFSTPALLERTLVLVHAPIPADGDRPGSPGIVAVGWPGFGGVLTAVSDAGVFTAIHDVPMKAIAGAEVTPRTVVMNEVLAQLDPTKTEDPGAFAQEIFDRNVYGMGGNVMLAWRGQGEDGAIGAGIFELGPARNRPNSHWRKPRAGESFIVTTNHFASTADDLGMSGCWRFRRLTESLLDEAKAPTDLATAFERIRSTRVRTTLYSVVANLGTGEFRALIRRRNDKEDGEGPAFVDTGVLDVHALIREAEAGATAPR